ncbi:MAG: fasciclin domain-containing protein [Gemmatimonadota bacterium]|jgi:uncharacterized surface protein with fasciclin (FAS1) repeats
MKFQLKATFVLLGALALGACEDDADLLAPESAEAFQARSANASPKKGEDPIAQIVLDNVNADEPQFTQLLAALQYVDRPMSEGGQAAGLVDLFLTGKDQFTVFAPTDAAFEGLYSFLTGLNLVIGPVDEIEDLPSGLVLDVLFYHVAEGRRGANSVVPRNGERTITPLLGETFAVTLGEESAEIIDGLFGLRSNAKIGPADISASNGIIHVIDQVIVPPSVVETVLSLIADS